ncbi:MAG: hypothetical protein FWE69_02900 [Clostridiales bacterium]|nr:hypothetical protein [Clostridiales bacterium]
MEVEKEIGKMLQKLSAIEIKLDTALSQQADHEQRIRLLESRGSRRWETLVTQVITLLAAAFIGWLLAK